MYRPDHVRTEAFDGSRKIGMYFQSEVDRYNPSKDFERLVTRISTGGTVSTEEAETTLAEAKKKMDRSTERYLSEDYLFCQNVRKIGMKVYLCPWMHLQHAGTYVFGGKLPALASIGASATADAELLRKQRAPEQPRVNPVNVPAPSAADDEILKKFRKI
jgi:hypothetical protein